MADGRRELFKVFLGLENSDSKEAVIKLLHAPTMGLENPVDDILEEHTAASDPVFEGLPEQMEKVDKNCETLIVSPTLGTIMDAGTPVGSASGSFHCHKTRTNLFVLSLFAQSGRQVTRTTKTNQIVRFHFCQPYVNSKSRVHYSRVDATLFSMSVKARPTTEDGLLPMALGLVEMDTNKLIETSAVVFPYNSKKVSTKMDKNKLHTWPMDSPAGLANMAGNNQTHQCSNVDKSGIQTCWNILVSETDHPLLADNSPAGSFSMKTAAIGVGILLRGMHLRYDGLESCASWVKLYKRLFQKGRILGLIGSNFSEDLSFQSMSDLCHVTYLLFDMVVDGLSIALVDGALRTVVSRMLATWTQQPIDILSPPVALKYPKASLYPSGLKFGAREVITSVLTPMDDPSNLDTQHGVLLRKLSHNINQIEHAATPRDLRGNMDSWVQQCLYNDRRPLNMEGEITKAALRTSFDSIRNDIIDFLFANHDHQTNVTEKSKEFLKTEKDIKKRAHNLESSLPSKSHKGAIFFCAVAMLTTNKDARTTVDDFVKLNGRGKLQHQPHFKVRHKTTCK